MNRNDLIKMAQEFLRYNEYPDNLLGRDNQYISEIMADFCLNPTNSTPNEFDILIKNIAVSFFYHWWNSTGSNTEEGFIKWWAEHKKDFII